MVRGSGKFKQKRGGGRNFSKNMTLDANGTAVGTGSIYNRRGPRNNKEGGEDDDAEGSEDEEDDEDEDEEEDEDSEEEEGEGAGKAPAQELSRAERKDLKKQQAAAKQKAKDGEGEGEDDDDLINPNHVEKKLNISDLGAPRQLSRREREEKEKKEAKDRYWKLHVQGKTQEAKTDLARLAKIRAERDAAQAKRKAEADAKAAEIEAKRTAQNAKRG